ncbi:MAG TPA: FAD-dependent oxidoreductase [Solirubrobacterales bacterium]|nr:FAD-dependent oxidoreductase [Solirubrobacterales bacterium]
MRTDADLVIVGGGLSGLWAAIQAKEDDPARDVVLLEADAIAHGATGNSGGFVSSSLTHGLRNGLARFPGEMPVLERLGRENLDQTVAALARYGIECDLVPGGEMTVALEPHEEAWLEEEAAQLRRFGHDATLLDTDAVRAEVSSPLYRAGLWLRSGGGTLHPAKLAWGLGRAALELGVRIFEHSRVTGLLRAGGGLRVSTTTGQVDARGAVLTTGAFRSPVRAVRRRIVPVWDYVLVSEPLDAARRASLGWANHQGVSDAGNQFHYYRLTADDRILWGGYDAVYKFGNAVGPQLSQRDASFARLARHLFTTFPQLEGLRFTHRWGGPIDTCSRFFAFFGTSHGGRVAYAAGHTGLGIGASRFGARMALDLLAGRRTEATQLRATRTQPLPFPPEPLRWAVIELTRNRLAAADRNRGRRGAWLRLLDRLGLGFDS